MAAVNESNSTLVSKCLAFCQTLASQGQAISFSLAIGPDFSFSLDTRSKDQHSLGTKKKKQSPSTLRRNARRREEFAKKKQASSAEILADDEELVTAQVLKCDQCDYVGASEKGLKQHMRMKHKTSGAPPQQEELRDSANAVKPLEASPVKEIREEQPIEHTFDCGDCEEVFESEVNLNTHIMKMMNDENDLQHATILCSGCKGVFKDREPRPAACPLCLMQCDSIS